jgi:putative heme iron utilization protein
MAAHSLLQEAATLLGSQRWAALATLDARQHPCGSMAAYALAPDGSGLLLHLSHLAEHTRNLLERPHASLTVSTPDNGRGDPQLLARLSLSGQALPVARESTAYGPAREAYLTRLPDAAPLFEFPDFRLFCLNPETARYVGGFGRADSFGWTELSSLLNP